MTFIRISVPHRDTGKLLCMIDAKFDKKADNWFAVAIDVPGLVVEGDSLDIVIEHVQDLAPSLIDSNGRTPRHVRSAERDMLAAIASECHATSFDHGFWEREDINDVCNGTSYGLLLLSQKIALMHSELSEALEELRVLNEATEKREACGLGPVPDFDNYLEELADTVIRVFDSAAAVGPARFASIMLAKMDRNKDRPRKHGKRF